MARYFSVKYVADRYGTNNSKVGKWIADGVLEAINVATKPNGVPRWRISPEALAAFEALRKSGAPKPAVKKPRVKAEKIIEYV